jgi:hypothetical protein
MKDKPAFTVPDHPQSDNIGKGSQHEAKAPNIHGMGDQLPVLRILGQKDSGRHVADELGNEDAGNEKMPGIIKYCPRNHFM